MAHVASSATLQAGQPSELNSAQKNQGSLKTASGEHVIELIPNTESVTEGVFEFLQEAAALPEKMTDLAEHVFFYFPQEMVEVELEIIELSQLLNQNLSEEGVPQKVQKPQTEPFTQKKMDLQDKSSKSSQSHQEGHSSTVVYTSLFSLARTFNQALNASKNKESQKNQNKAETKHDSLVGAAKVSASREDSPIKESRFEKERDKDKEKKQGQGFGREQGKRDDDSKKQKQNKKRITGVSASKGTSGSHSGGSAGGGTPSIDNIFIRFMALMAKILGQAEAEAHALYLRIKERTDSIDVLTHLISKINSVKGDIDWTKDEEMKKLVDKARELGVDIPQGKYKWNEDEKKLLKENIQMRKDSMEKVTQLERTDMQRYLQEASQCHQARSNILKLLKEVMDTIIHNIRP